MPRGYDLLCYSYFLWFALYLLYKLELKQPGVVSYAGDNVRWGVWLGRHIC